jgi:hypothetical protein
MAGSSSRGGLEVLFRSTLPSRRAGVGSTHPACEACCGRLAGTPAGTPLAPLSSTCGAPCALHPPFHPPPPPPPPPPHFLSCPLHAAAWLLAGGGFWRRPQPSLLPAVQAAFSSAISPCPVAFHCPVAYVIGLAHGALVDRKVCIKDSSCTCTARHMRLQEHRKLELRWQAKPSRMASDEVHCLVAMMGSGARALVVVVPMHNAGLLHAQPTAALPRWLEARHAASLLLPVLRACSGPTCCCPGSGVGREGLLPPPSARASGFLPLGPAATSTTGWVG